MKTGIELITEERLRQKGKWDALHDAGHQYGDLAVHAAALAVMGADAIVDDCLERGSLGSEREGVDCWGLQEKHSGDRKQQLVIAGALIAAEIDRLQRETQLSKQVKE